MEKNKIVLLVGVGGQGTILAGDLLAKTAAASGYDVKISEIHGMSQRGGSVSTVVSFGEDVHTMIADEGTADVVVNDEEIVPVPVNIGIASMPADTHERLGKIGATLIPAGEIARNANAPKSTNVVLMGALSTVLPFEEQTWRDVIAQRVPPKTVDTNLATFAAGREAAGA